MPKLVQFIGIGNRKRAVRDKFWRRNERWSNQCGNGTQDVLSGSKTRSSNALILEQISIDLFIRIGCSLRDGSVWTSNEKFDSWIFAFEFNKNLPEDVKRRFRTSNTFLADFGFWNRIVQQMDHTMRVGRIRTIELAFANRQPSPDTMCSFHRTLSTMNISHDHLVF